TGSRYRACHGLHQLIVLLCKVRLTLMVKPGDTAYQIRKGRQLIAWGFREIGTAKEWLLIQRQEHGQRPATIALRQHLVSGLVDLVNIRPFLTIDLDIDEMLVHDGRDFSIFERLVRHDMAPVTGGIPYR